MRQHLTQLLSRHSCLTSPVALKAFTFAVVLRVWFLSCCCPVAKSFPTSQTTVPLIASALLKRGEQRMGWERKSAEPGVSSGFESWCV